MDGLYRLRERYQKASGGRVSGQENRPPSPDGGTDRPHSGTPRLLEGAESSVANQKFYQVKLLYEFVVMLVKICSDHLSVSKLADLG